MLINTGNSVPYVGINYILSNNNIKNLVSMLFIPIYLLVTLSYITAIRITPIVE